MPFLSPNQQCQSTEGKNITFHWLAYPSSPGGLPTLSLITNSFWLPWGGLPCLSSALIRVLCGALVACVTRVYRWCQYLNSALTYKCMIDIDINIDIYSSSNLFSKEFLVAGTHCTLQPPLLSAKRAYFTSGVDGRSCSSSNRWSFHGHPAPDSTIISPPESICRHTDTSQVKSS